ncbi:MAG: hypothetical protein ACUVWA_02385 [Candidatus Oleimicrobiaceae bacterium]
MATTGRRMLAVAMGTVLVLMVAGCYTQIAKVRVESEATYDEYEERYVEADTTEEVEADSTVYHRVDVYHHGLYRGPYSFYDPWWYWWDPYWDYPWRFSFAWRVHYYWDPWYAWYPYWGDPWYWTPFSYYGGWAYYGPGWGWSYYYHPYYFRYRYWDQPYARRPFQRRPMLAGGGTGPLHAPPMTAVSATRTRSPQEGAGAGQELARPASDRRRTVSRRGEEAVTRRVVRDERSAQGSDKSRRIVRDDAAPATRVQRDTDIARRVPKNDPPRPAPAKPAQTTKPTAREHSRVPNSSAPPTSSAPKRSYSPPPSSSPPPPSHSGSSGGSSGGSRQSSGSSRTRTRG